MSHPDQPRIVFATPYPDAAARAREMLPAGFELIVADPEPGALHAAARDAEYLVGFVAGLVREALYAAAPRLRLVQLLSAGYDPVDIAAARASGVPVATNGGANSTAVSEHAVMLMLAVARRLPSQHANVVAGRWRGNDPPRLYELRGRTLGLIGLGAIGKKVARLARAFGMRVVYHDVSRLAEDAEDLLDARFRLLDELLAESDVVSLHVPLGETTHHLLDAAAIARMKPGAMVINTSRGAVIDESALYHALVENRLLGAGLDVFEREPPREDNPLFALDNVVLTAHMAGPTFESHTARLRNAFDNVQRVARGEPALWVIPELAR